MYAEEFLPLAVEIPIVPEVEVFLLAQASGALVKLRRGTMRGAAVLHVER